MKIVTQSRKVTAVGIQATREFTVKAGAHIMAVLSGLYADPVDAIVREYLTNMYDAYKALWRVKGKANVRHTPPRLILPSAFSPELVFMDFGIGMSKETVWDIFTSYGETTKDDSNDEVGGFGLGSKTAFCYNGGTAWTVESRYNGEKHLFIAAMGTNNIPRLDHVSTAPTDEPSGVTIRIPIRRDDITDVVRAAERYVPFFPAELGLEVDGAGPIAPVSYHYKGGTWGLHSPKRSPQTSFEGVRIIMGNVPYKWDNNQRLPLPLKLHRDNNYQAQYFFRNNGIDLHVPVGSVDIVPSRDNLKYTDRTMAAIKEALAVFLKELPDVMGAALSTCKTEWTALEETKKLQDIPYFDAVLPGIKWNGKMLNPADGVVRTVAAFQALDPKMEMTIYGNEDSDHATMDPRTVASVSMRPNDTTFIVRDDMPKGTIKAVKSLLHHKLVSKSGNRARRWGHKMGHAIVIKTTLTDKAIADFFGGMPESMITTASSLTGYAPPPSLRLLGKDTLYRFSPNTLRWEARVRIPTDAKTFYYLPLEKSASNGRYVYESNDETARVLRTATALGIIERSSVIYGIKSSEVKTFDKKVWLPLLATMEKETTAWVAKNLLTTRSALSGRHNMMNLVSVLEWTKATNKHPSLMELVKFYRAGENADSIVIQYIRDDAKRRAAVDTQLNDAKVPTEKEIQTAVASRFPMLLPVSRAFREYTHQDDKKVILDYIESLC